MSTVSARVWYRPVRIGWCIADGDLKALRRAWALTHTLWGGRYNPVIPVAGSDSDHVRQLIAAFEVDYLFPVSGDAAVTKVLKQFSHLAWSSLFNRPSLFFKIGQEKVSEALDVYHAIRLLAARHEERPNRLRPAAVLFAPDDTDPLRDLVFSTHGSYPSPPESGRDYPRLLKDFLGASQLMLQPLSPVPATRPSLRTPNSITSLDLKPDRSLGTFWRPGFYVGSAANFSDLVHFWNLRAAGIDLAFFDPAYADRLAKIRTGILLGGHEIAGSEADRPDLNLWHAGGASHRDVEGLDPRTRSFVVSTDTWRQLRPPQMRWRPYTQSGIAVEPAVARANSIPLHRKPFDEDAAGREKVAFTLEFPPGPGEGEFSYRLPNFPALAPLLTLRSFLEETIRFGRRGTTYIIPASAEVLQVHGWDAVSLVRAVFEVAGITATPSSAGKRATRLIQQMGGLLECEVFKIPGVRALLKEFSASQAFEAQEALKHIGSGFPAYEDLGIIPRSGANLAPSDVFNHLVERGIFRIGLRLECDHCRLPFWISLDEAKARTQCEFCGNFFHIARQLGAKYPWRYRRSGLFGADDDQQGAVPVTLALHRLYTTFRVEDDYLWIAFTTGMDLEDMTAGIPRCETDLVILTQTAVGDVNVLIGECKTASRIERKDVENLGTVARALENAGLNAYILFSKLADFSPEEIEEIRRLDRPGPPRVILLTAREIEPTYLYSRTEEEFDLRISNLELSGLAEATRDAFLSPKLRNSENSGASG